MPERLLSYCFSVALIANVSYGSRVPLFTILLRGRLVDWGTIGVTGDVCSAKTPKV